MEPIAELDKIEGPEQAARARRSQMYRFLAECFRYPSEDFFTIAMEGGHLETAMSLMEDIPFDVEIDEEKLAGRQLEGVSREDFEAEFVRVFDAGPGGPPCPLYEGQYAADRKVNMEDLVRFYNHFGLSVAEAPERELPDHITAELEFMHYLAFKEVLALQRGEDPSPYCKAEVDFLRRHPAKWLPQLGEKAGKVAKQTNIPGLCAPAVTFYGAIIGFAANFCNADLEHLKRLNSGA